MTRESDPEFRAVVEELRAQVGIRFRSGYDWNQYATKDVKKTRRIDEWFIESAHTTQEVRRGSRGTQRGVRVPV